MFFLIGGVSTTLASTSGLSLVASDDKSKSKPPTRSRFGKADVASVAGRVLTVKGNAISNAQIGLYNADTDQWIYARTGTFGQYAFHELPLSDFYVLVVIHKRHLFLDGSRTFTLEGDMFNVNFVASPIE